MTDDSLPDNTLPCAAGQFTLTMHASQTSYCFQQVDSGSNDLYLKSTIDRSGNTITYNYVTGTHQLSSIVDTDGRTLTVGYNSSGYLHTITDNFGPVSRTWTYDYDTSVPGNLKDYIDAAGNETDYTYTQINGKYYLSTVTAPEQTDHDRPKAVLGYTNAQLSQLQLQTGTSGGSPVYATFAWAYYSGTDVTSGTRCDATSDHAQRAGTVTDMSDTPLNTSTYCFADMTDGNKGDESRTAVYDGLGHRRSSSYNPDRKPASLTSPEDDGVTNGSTVAGFGDGTSDSSPTDQLQSVTEPNDPGDTAANAIYKYNASSSIPGYRYLPTSVKDTNGNCTRYVYVDKNDPDGDPAVGSVKSTTIGLTPSSNDCSTLTGSQQWHVIHNAHGQITANGTPTAPTQPVTTLDTPTTPTAN